MKDINIKKLILHITLLSILVLNLSVSPPTGKQSHLAIGLFVGANSSVITFAFVSTRAGKIIGSQTVRKERFMYTALGHWPGYVNPKRENLLLKHGIDSCMLLENDLGKIDGYYCPIFENLWKVRFNLHPVKYDLVGWSHGKYKPSPKQQQFLAENYGNQNVLTDYIYGDSLFKLLRDMQSQTWINTYISLSADP